LSGATVAHAQYSVLHELAFSDGSYPQYTTPVVSGSTLYGMAYKGGGGQNRGTVFKMNTDGTGFSLLHVFSWSVDDGSKPNGSLTLDGSTLYGMTCNGPSTSDRGTVFKMNTDGTGFSLLHEFAGGDSDGQYPKGSLTLDGSTLYGMTCNGGDFNSGTVFKMNTNGTGYSVLCELGSGFANSRPYGALTLSGSTLYGMSCNGGPVGNGALFRMSTDGISFTNLHEFAGGDSDGKYPYGSLTLSGSVLYGMTYRGGDSDSGTVFKMNTDGTGFSLLHEFAGGDSDGKCPFGSLTLSGSTLYGTTFQGGDSDYGTLFRMNTDGGGYTNLHEFAGGDSDGKYSLGSLTLSGSTLYGMTTYGGDSDYGTLFSYGGVGQDPATPNGTIFKFR